MIKLAAADAFGQVVLQNAKLQNAKLSVSGSAAPPAGLYIVTAGQGTSVQNAFSGFLGLSFTPNTTITITSLGKAFVPGDSHTHTIQLVDPVCTVLATATLDMSQAQTTVGGVQYVFVPITPVTLTFTVPTQYSIVVLMASGVDSYYQNDVTLTPSGDCTIDHSIFGTCSFSSGGGANTSYGPINASYTKP